MPGELVVRPSRPADIRALAAIYRHHVMNGIASFEEMPPEPAEMARRRRAVLARGLPHLVAEEAGRVVGYCYAAPYRPRSAYRFTVEDSIYVDAAEVGRGIGRVLLHALIERCETLGLRQMIAVIGGREQWPSIRLHEALGFWRVGRLPAVGYKFGSWIDVVLMQRPLGPGAATPPVEPGARTGGSDG